MASAAPPCPRCNKKPTVPLARDGDIQRFQCEPCAHVFTGLPVDPPPAPPAPAPDAPRGAYVAILPPDPHDPPPRSPQAPQGATFSPTGETVKGYCPKCLRPYFRIGKKFDAHVAGCDGTKTWTAPKPAPPAPKPAAPLVEQLEFPDTDAPPLPQGPAQPPPPLPAPVALPEETRRALALSVQALQTRRAALLAEIDGIDAAILTINKLRGEEAPAGPFPVRV